MARQTSARKVSHGKSGAVAALPPGCQLQASGALVPPWVLPCAEIAPEESLEQPCFGASSEPGDRSSSRDRCTQKMPLREHPRLHQRLLGVLPGVSRDRGGPGPVAACDLQCPELPPSHRHTHAHQAHDSSTLDPCHPSLDPVRGGLYSVMEVSLQKERDRTERSPALLRQHISWELPAQSLLVSKRTNILLQTIATLPEKLATNIMYKATSFCHSGYFMQHSAMQLSKDLVAPVAPLDLGTLVCLVNLVLQADPFLQVFLTYLDVLEYQVHHPFLEFLVLHTPHVIPFLLLVHGPLDNNKTNTDQFYQNLLIGAFFSHLVVPGVLAVQQALVIPVGPPLVHLGGLASLAVLGGQGHLNATSESLLSRYAWESLLATPGIPGSPGFPLSPLQVTLQCLSQEGQENLFHHVLQGIQVGQGDHVLLSSQLNTWLSWETRISLFTFQDRIIRKISWFSFCPWGTDKQIKLLNLALSEKGARTEL
ncbi:hypothetical protein LUU34_00294700 [Aix galericulata]|nr:hypothetical protein LUU34_00294700 [Aix galericulata]